MKKHNHGSSTLAVKKQKRAAAKQVRSKRRKARIAALVSSKMRGVNRLLKDLKTIIDAQQAELEKVKGPQAQEGVTQ